MAFLDTRKEEPTWSQAHLHRSETLAGVDAGLSPVHLGLEHLYDLMFNRRLVLCLGTPRDDVERRHEADDVEYLRYATAAASASIMLPGTQLCLKKDFDELFPRAAVQRL